MKARLFPRDEKWERRMAVENAYMDDVALKLGVFDQRLFLSGHLKSLNIKALKKAWLAII